ncbi:MAG: hypothetical protein FJW34_08635 [Acidobacteria bacterium]|nr:hypothetical protein [Acidobacteriota bacterium]
MAVPRTRPDFSASSTRPSRRAPRSASTNPSITRGWSSVAPNESPVLCRSVESVSDSRTLNSVPAGTVTRCGSRGAAGVPLGGVKEAAGLGASAGAGAGGGVVCGGAAGALGAAVCGASAGADAAGGLAAALCGAGAAGFAAASAGGALSAAGAASGVGAGAASAAGAAACGATGGTALCCL